LVAGIRVRQEMGCLYDERKDMALVNRLLCVFLILGAAGCAAGPVKERAPAAPAPVEHSGLLINHTLIDDRIRFLKGVLRDDQLPPADRETVEAVLAAYRQLKGASGPHLTEKDYQGLILSLFKAVSLMDEAYLGEKRIPGDGKSAVARFAERRKALIDRYARGDAKGVIQDARSLEKAFGPRVLTGEAGILYALSLAREGDLKEAVAVGKAVASRLEQFPDRVQLCLQIARWQLSLGRPKQAAETYEKLIHIQDERAALVQELGQQIAAAREAAVGGPTGIASRGQGSDVAWQEEGHAGDPLVERVRSLVQDHAYDKARLLILRARIRMGDGPGKEALDRELERIDEQEAAFEAGKSIKGDDLAKTRDAAREMIEAEKYEAAIQAIEEAEDSSGLDPELRALRERAVESLINRERNRAAELFLAAKKADDPSQKKEFLDSAYHILKELIDTYPSSPLNQKLKSHMAVVQQELDNL